MPSPFPKLAGPDFLAGEHDMLRFWEENRTFDALREQTEDGEPWTFLDGPMTANNPMGVHHAWGRTYKDAFRRFHAMNGRKCWWQNGFDCQGLWVEVEVQKEFDLKSKADIEAFGVDRFVTECKKRVLRFAARQTEQSIRLGYWMDWDRPDELRRLADVLGEGRAVSFTTASGEVVTGHPEEITARLGSPRDGRSDGGEPWGGSYFTFSTENNETIWQFLKVCHERGKVYRGNDVMPWGGTAGSAYSQMEVADGRKLTTHRSVFVRFPIRDRENEYLLAWTTTPWTLTSNVACAVSADLDYARVKLNKDGSILHVAAEALNNQRLAKEFKEGFGSDGPWPEDVPKLKTLAQIFKEQGGYEVVGTVKGAELIGLQYDGPFDHLPAQQSPGGFPAEPGSEGEPSSAQAHRVIDGGRDSRGSSVVTAAEGTGIVHTAPGCGDIDHKLSAEHGLPTVAPLDEAGRFIDGFGEFTGLAAYEPDAAALVLERLKENGFHVADERYPHIYPHCWRTGEELIFRLVDEWLIRMDWRDEIKDVVKSIDWRPESVDGERRELEWLDNMRDWMVSKKRFWGLALPIWADPETGDFEVIGSLKELEERAVEGWDGFAGRTPHKPWIDGVKIKSSTTGKLLSRVPDVGNPWLDAGITPFSTTGYNVDRDAWEGIYPVDLVSESFPGQFRNWFYSLLALGTMLRHEQTDVLQKRPFKTLFGYKLVLDETGTPMHKSDGTAIWFEEAAEQLGVDTMRWMYLAQDPARDLRFGTRHPDNPVPLKTPEGEIEQTLEGFPTCEVTSGPADDTRRRVLIPLWNCLTFFTEYARADGFEITDKNIVGLKDRPEIDRWLMARLRETVGEVNAGYEDYRPADVCGTIEAFLDDLSNWYIRRNRRRFWRTADASDADKRAAYLTLYSALVTLSKLIAPSMPFLAERIYQALVIPQQKDTPKDERAPHSVHLCSFPRLADYPADPDETLTARMAAAQTVVRLGHRLREETGHRVRQPLAELKIAADSPAVAAAVESLAEVIADELNVKAVTPAESLDDLVKYTFKPNLKTLGPRCGKRLGAIRQEFPAMSDELAPLRRGENVTVTVGGEPLDLSPEDVLVTTEQSGDWASASETLPAGDGVTVALSTVITPELKVEGLARDFVRMVQEARKGAGLELSDRIVVTYDASDAARTAAVEAWDDYIRGETLADALEPGETGGESVTVRKV
ncbi:class I tRNA ligase family protein [Alienimonas chondri]|uniref:Isoleucine--tRNA ligase n=1 Tax=Alienimonas chondri TaxID=2681879 RepID=A0ABX1VDF2_9PLAN|nr:class I tRNA ligase family protein [Alienimonas chondri]NNJ25729.1 Isoleucine--tRNA ligase [Alienimonas chondri]